MWPLESTILFACVQLERTICFACRTRTYGGMAEWLKAAVLKTVEPQGSVGSNPTASASLDTFAYGKSIEPTLRPPVAPSLTYLGRPATWEEWNG